MVPIVTESVKIADKVLFLLPLLPSIPTLEQFGPRTLEPPSLPFNFKLQHDLGSSTVTVVYHTAAAVTVVASTFALSRAQGCLRTVDHSLLPRQALLVEVHLHRHNRSSLI